MTSHKSADARDPAPLRAVIYARVSLDLAGEGRSVARQIDACRSLADARDYVVVGVESDTQSAYVDQRRPGWERVKAAAQRGDCDVILSWQLDRVTRSIRELEQLIEVTEQTGVAVATVSGELDLTTSNGRLIARILGAVARAESEMRAMRLILANLDRATRGIPRTNGTQLFGYDREHNQIPVEARAIQRAAHDILNGTATLTTILRRWDRAGLRPHLRPDTGKGWTLGGIRLLLINPRLAGLSIYRGQVVGRGNWRPIIRVSTHERLVVALERTPRNVPPPSLLAGIAFCRRCGALHTVVSHGRGRIGYICRNRHGFIDQYRADGRVRAFMVGVVGAERFDDASLEEKRAMIEEAITVGISHGSRSGRHASLEERVRVYPRWPNQRTASLAASG